MYSAVKLLQVCLYPISSFWAYLNSVLQNCPYYGYFGIKYEPAHHHAPL